MKYFLTFVLVGKEVKEGTPQIHFTLILNQTKLTRTGFSSYPD